jgi:hypothetical protein
MHEEQSRTPRTMPTDWPRTIALLAVAFSALVASTAFTVSSRFQPIPSGGNGPDVVIDTWRRTACVLRIPQQCFPLSRMKFDRAWAKAAGYTDAEIDEYLKKSSP